MANALMALEPTNLTELKGVAQIFAESGLFSDARDMAKAFVKIMAGRELGFGAFASMNGINIIQNKPALGANLIAAAIKRHPSPRYDYRVVELSNDTCIIDFYQDGEKIGQSSFSMKDAAAAQLATKDNWRKNPRNMLFARAISNGARWYCPDVFGGPVYTPDELGAVIDDEGVVIEGEIIEPTPDPEPPKPAASAPRPPVVDEEPEPDEDEQPAPKAEPEHEPAEVVKAATPATQPREERRIPNGTEHPAPVMRILSQEETTALVEYMLELRPEIKQEKGSPRAHAGKACLNALKVDTWMQYKIATDNAAEEIEAARAKVWKYAAEKNAAKTGNDTEPDALAPTG